MPAAVPIRVTGSQSRFLRRTRATTQNRRVWSRVTGLLMLTDGKPCQDVARSLGVNLDTVTDWKHRWMKGGISSLTDKPRSGRPPRVTSKYLRVLEQAVERGPRAYGFLFSVWSSGRLAAHLEKETGIALKAKRVRIYLMKLGFVYRRPKHSLKNRQDPAKVKAAERHLHALKKGLSGPEPDTNSGSRTKPTSTFTLI